MRMQATAWMIIAVLSVGGIAAQAGAGCGGGSCGGTAGGGSHDMVVAAADDKKEEKHEHQSGQAAPDKDAYPLDTCVVSGEKLDSMDDLVKYAYKTPDGKEREVRFCCKGCIKKFKKDPEKHLKILDEAAAKKTV